MNEYIEGQPWHRHVPVRVTEYLSNGGLFNPELMDHEAVRNMLIDARDVIEITAREKATPPPDSPLMAAARKVVEARRYSGDDGWDKLKNAISELEGVIDGQ